MSSMFCRRRTEVREGHEAIWGKATHVSSCQCDPPVRLARFIVRQDTGLGHRSSWVASCNARASAEVYSRRKTRLDHGVEVVAKSLDVVDANLGLGCREFGQGCPLNSPNNLWSQELGWFDISEAFTDTIMTWARSVIF